jgi:LysM repeat protein
MAPPETSAPETEPVAGGEKDARPNVERGAPPEAPPVPPPAGHTADRADLPPAHAAPTAPLPDVVEAEMRETRAPVTTIMAIVALIVTVALGAIVLQASASSDLLVQLFPTATPLVPTPTFTPTVTSPPTETSEPTLTPTVTTTPLPTDTPRPPRFHTVQPNESWFTLALIYGVTADSIAQVNGREPGAFLQVNEAVVIPWPTATPPLVPVTVDLDGQAFIADPGSCDTLYEIQPNDSLVSIGAQFNVDFRAILAVNRLDAEAFIRPGDVVCIPDVAFFDGEVPATPGPSPTPGPTEPPAGPLLLYPPDDFQYDLQNEPVILQWVAVKDLRPDEWYMVELIDLTDFAAYPRRGFTRDNAYLVPEAWRPPVVEPHRFRWQVSVVVVVGERADGVFERTFGGRASTQGHFIWQGAVPTATPTLTPTLTPTP